MDKKFQYNQPNPGSDSFPAGRRYFSGISLAAAMQHALICFLFFLILSGCDDLFEKDISDSVIESIAPASGWKTENHLVNFSWSALDGATEYYFELAWPSFSDMQERICDSVLTETKLSLALSEGSYEWRVRGQNFGYGSVFSKAKFEITPAFDITKKTVTLTEPVNSRLLSQSFVNFKWEQVDGAHYYHIKIKKNSWTGDSIASVQTSRTDFGIDLEDGKYTWGVAAFDTIHKKNSDYSQGNFTVLVKLVTDIRQSTVILRSPNTSSPITDNSVTFWWDDVNGAEKYLLQVVSPGFDQTSNLLVNEWTEETTKTVELSPGTYQWRVKAANSLYSTAWSTGSFLIYKSDIASQLVELVSPADGALLNSAPVKFQWLRIGECEYQFVLKKGTWDSGTEIQRKKLNDTTVELSLTDGDYAWGVKAIDPIDKSETEYAFRSLSIDKTPPSVPVLTSPINNAEIEKGPYTLEWQSTDSGQEGMSYVIRLYKQAGAQNTLITEQSVTSTAYTYNFTESGTWLWQVRAMDKANNAGEFSVLNKFMLPEAGSLENKVVTLKAPYNGYESSKPEITFWWDTPEDADSYVFQLVKPGFRNIEELIRDVSLTTNQITVQPDPGTYQWRVKAKNSTSETPFSAEFTVIVLPAP